MQNLVWASQALIQTPQRTDLRAKNVRTSLAVNSVHHRNSTRTCFGQLGVVRRDYGGWNVSYHQSATQTDSASTSDSNANELDPDFQEAMNEVGGWLDVLLIWLSKYLSSQWLLELCGWRNN